MNHYLQRSIESFDEKRLKPMSLPMKSFYLLCIATLLCYSGFSQEAKIAITGTVTDSTGTGIPSASVTEKGTKNTTATSVSGTFSIKVSGANAVLVVNSVGYLQKEVAVGSQTNVTVSLQQT